MPFLKIQTASWAWVAICKPGEFWCDFFNAAPHHIAGNASISAGAGSVIDAVENHDIEQWHLPKQWLRQLGNGQIDSLKLLSVIGDSMVPRLLHGDIVMIDTSQRTASPPGIFALHDGLGLVIKQIEPIPNTSPITLRMFSDNNAYSAYDRSIDEVCIIGRVVWFARTI